MLFSFCPRICRPHKMQRRITMAFNFAIQTLIEFAVILLLIYGFCREDKLIEFEDRIKARIRERTDHNRKGNKS